MTELSNFLTGVASALEWQKTNEWCYRGTLFYSQLSRLYNRLLSLRIPCPAGSVLDELVRMFAVYRVFVGQFPYEVVLGENRWGPLRVSWQTNGEGVEFSLALGSDVVSVFQGFMQVNLKPAELQQLVLSSRPGWCPPEQAKHWLSTETPLDFYLEDELILENG